MRYHQISRAFTLIEVLFVVVILGILASVVMAMVAVNQNDTRQVGASITEQRVQEAIELYRHHTGQLPDLVGANWTPLTTQTTVNGNTVGPFLFSVPQNALAPSHPSVVVDATGTADIATCAFAYDYQSGQGTGKFTAARPPAVP